MSKIIFLDWRPNNRRAQSIAKDIGATLYLAPNILRKKVYAPIRYFYLLFWTITVLIKSRPRVVFVSTPPTFGPIIVFTYAKLFNCAYVVDASHTATMAYWRKVPFGFWFNKFVMNQSLATLVHNECIKELTDKQGIDSIVLETKIPELQVTNEQRIADDFTVLTPCSFDADEPIDEIFNAAELMPDINFSVTGSYARLHKEQVDRCPANLTLTGFLSERDYDLLLNSVNVVLVLTTDDYPVRPRGASEAIAAEKPLIVSLNQATEKHLGKGTILISNTAEEIIQSILKIRNQYEHYKTEIKQLKDERMSQYKLEIRELNRLIGGSNSD
jgi:glycosyltransferase involved in cell wall biosynthesis